VPASIGVIGDKWRAFEMLSDAGHTKNSTQSLSTFLTGTGYASLSQISMCGMSTPGHVDDPLAKESSMTRR
jgi:hypothetical protein